MRRITLVGIVCLLPLRLDGAVSVGQPPMEWIEPTTPEKQKALAASPAYQRFLDAAPGPWSAEFDPVLMTPRAIDGDGVPLFAEDTNPNDVAKGVLEFLDDHAALFGAKRGDFVIDGMVPSRDLWVVVAVQRYEGIPVLGSHLSLSIKQGRLVLIQGVSHRVAGVGVTPRLGKEQAVGAARRAFGLRMRETGKRRDSDEARSVILPLRRPGAVEYRLAWEVTSRREGNQGSLVQNIVSHVDAANGDVLAAYDANRHDYSGTAAIEVERRTVGDPVVAVPAPFLDLVVAGAATRSDAAGAFSVPAPSSGPQSITSQLRGSRVLVTNAAGANAAFSGTIDADTPFGLVWDASNSDPSERMTYRAVVETNRFAAAVFPTLAWLDTTVPAVVNVNDACNAFWDGTGMSLFRGGSGCNATGRIFDVVAHEWGHGLDQNLPGGFVDAGLSEFIGDMMAFVQTDDPRIAPGFFSGTGSGHLRDLEADACFDASRTAPHDAGQLLGSVVWDIHEDLEAAGMNAADLRRLMLLPIAAAQTRSEWYRAMLVVDDDDGRLSNGTPNECLIYRQFELHSCGADRWPGIPSREPRGCDPVNHPPVAEAGPDQVVTCAGPEGTDVTLDASASFDRDGDDLTYVWSGSFGTREGRTVTVRLPRLDEAILLTVSDGSGSDTDEVRVTVQEWQGPAVGNASPAVLWPPNHDMIPVTMTVSAMELCFVPAVCRVTSVESNEPVSGTGEGDTAPDWIIDGDRVLLRAERSPRGTGRIYTSHVECTDELGNPFTTTTATVTVPRHQP
jgi:hypothetical protein